MLGAPGAIAIAAGLCVNRTLKRLDMCDSAIMEKGCEALVTLMQDNFTLLTLDFRSVVCMLCVCC